MQAVVTKNRTILHAIDGSAFKTGGSLSFGISSITNVSDSNFMTLKGGSESVWTVEVLTKDELIYHTKANLGTIAATNVQVFCSKVK